MASAAAAPPTVVKADEHSALSEGKSNQKSTLTSSSSPLLTTNAPVPLRVAKTLVATSAAATENKQSSSSLSSSSSSSSSSSTNITTDNNTTSKTTTLKPKAAVTKVSKATKNKTIKAKTPKAPKAPQASQAPQAQKKTKATKVVSKIASKTTPNAPTAASAAKQKSNTSTKKGSRAASSSASVPLSKGQSKSQKCSVKFSFGADNNPTPIVKFQKSTENRPWYSSQRSNKTDPYFWTQLTLTNLSKEKYVYRVTMPSPLNIQTDAPVGFIDKNSSIVLKLRISAKKTVSSLVNKIKSRQQQKNKSSVMPLNEKLEIRIVRLTTKQMKTASTKTVTAKMSSSMLADREGLRTTIKTTPVAVLIKPTGDKKITPTATTTTVVATAATATSTATATATVATATSNTASAQINAELQKGHHQTDAARFSNNRVVMSLKLSNKGKADRKKIFDALSSGQGIAVDVKKTNGNRVEMTVLRRIDTVEFRGTIKHVRRSADTLIKSVGKGKFKCTEAVVCSNEVDSKDGRETKTTSKGKVSSAATKSNPEKFIVVFQLPTNESDLTKNFFAKLFGRNRNTLRSMNRKSGADINVDKNKCTVIVSGTTHASANKARAMVEKMISSAKIKCESVSPVLPFPKDVSIGNGNSTKGSKVEKLKKIDDVAKQLQMLKAANAQKVKEYEATHMKGQKQQGQKTKGKARSQDTKSQRVAQRVHPGTFQDLPLDQQLLRTRTNGFVSANDFEKLTNELRRNQTAQTKKRLSNLTTKQRKALERDYQEELVAQSSKTDELTSSISSAATLTKKELVAQKKKEAQQKREADKQKRQQQQLKKAQDKINQTVIQKQHANQPTASATYPVVITVPIFQHAPNRASMFARVQFRKLIKFSDRNGTQLSFDQRQGLMHFKSKSTKHCMAAMAMVADNFAQLFSNENGDSTGLVTSNKLRDQDMKNKDNFAQATLCLNMDPLTVSLLTGSYGGLIRVLEAAHSTTVSIDISTGTIKIQGSDKRVSEVTRLLLDLLTDKTIYWSIVQKTWQYRNLESHVVIGKRYRDRAKKVLIGDGSTPTELRNIENMSGATLKFEPNRSNLKLYIQSKNRAQVKKAQDEIERRLLELGIDTPSTTARTSTTAKSLLSSSPSRSTSTNSRGRNDGGGIGQRKQGMVPIAPKTPSFMQPAGPRSASGPNHPGMRFMQQQASPSFMQPASPSFMQPVGMQQQFSQNTHMQLKMMHVRAMQSSMGRQSAIGRVGVGGVGGKPIMAGTRLHPHPHTIRGGMGGQLLPPHQQHSLPTPPQQHHHVPLLQHQQQYMYPNETRIPSDEFLDECQTALCRAFQNDAATGDDSMCWSILQYASRGTQWRIEPGENSWTCTVVLSQSALTKWRMFVRLHADIAKKANGRKIVQCCKRGMARLSRRQNASLSLQTWYRSRSIFNRYNRERKKDKSILYLQSLSRMWLVRLCLLQKWKRCSCCGYRLPDTCYTASQVKKGAKRVCILSRCKTGEKLVLPNENKMVKNMFPIRRKRRTLGDIERTWKPQKATARGQGGGRGGGGGRARPGKSNQQATNPPPPGYYPNSHVSSPKRGVSAPPMMMSMPMNMNMNMGINGAYMQQQPGMAMNGPPPPGMAIGTVSAAGGVLAGMGINMRSSAGGGGGGHLSRPPPGMTGPPRPSMQQPPSLLLGKQENEKLSQYFELINRALSTSILTADKHSTLEKMITQGNFAEVEQEMLRAYKNTAGSPTSGDFPTSVEYRSGPPSPTYNSMPAQQNMGQTSNSVPQMQPLRGNNSWGSPNSSPTRERQQQQQPPPQQQNSNVTWGAQNNNVGNNSSAPPPGFLPPGQRMGARQGPPGIAHPLSARQPPAFRATPGRPTPPGFARNHPPPQLAPPAQTIQTAPPAQAAEPPKLPYGGDINAAMKAQDREAIRQLMKVRDEVNNKQQKAKRV